MQEVTLNATEESLEALKGRDTLTINGTIDYQACDDAICYEPTTIPVSWTLKVRELDRVRARQ